MAVTFAADAAQHSYTRSFLTHAETTKYLRFLQQQVFSQLNYLPQISTTSPSVIKVGVIKHIYSPLIKQDVSPQLSLTHFGILFITHSNFQCKNKEEKDFVGSNIT